jgi:hypothetical protein
MPSSSESHLATRTPSLNWGGSRNGRKGRKGRKEGKEEGEKEGS